MLLCWLADFVLLVYVAFYHYIGVWTISTFSELIHILVEVKNWHLMLLVLPTDNFLFIILLHIFKRYEVVIFLQLLVLFYCQVCNICRLVELHCGIIWQLVVDPLFTMTLRKEKKLEISLAIQTSLLYYILFIYAYACFQLTI